MAMPQVPPRSSRSHNQPPTFGVLTDAPRVPPRPGRRADRSESPHRESFALSPLNEPPLTAQGNDNSGLDSSNGYSVSNSSLGIPPRPPSVSLPTIGQEGTEYADLEYDGPVTVGDRATSSTPAQTRNVGSDLPLHAPRPSLSTSDAKARIATVTRTDSYQATAAGIGQVPTPVHGDDREANSRALKTKASFPRASSSASIERASSIKDDGEHGIPEIGQRVPMYPNAGDVQAPSPSPFQQNAPTGIGFHNDGVQKSRHHGRTRSGREVFHGPPGSYGLHGHGTPHVDKFEKAWYDKHPDAIHREGHGQYGPGIGGSRGEWALSSEDLNKIVRDTASRGAGYGTSPDIGGFPNEQIGYMATEEYASRLNSPKNHNSIHQNKAHPNQSQTHVESPLKKTSFLREPLENDGAASSQDAYSGNHPISDRASESETDDEDVIHIDPPDHSTSKYGGNGYDPPTEDVGPRGGNTDSAGGWIEEHGYGVPILASDEVAKKPGLEHLQPAVSPPQEQRSSGDWAPLYPSSLRHGSRSGSAASSRPTSRPASIHGTLPNLSRFVTHDDRDDMHTPLEDVEEYEPLFPEDDKKDKAMSAADRFKQRPDMKRRFPSQDIWEDTPNSLQLETTISHPELLDEQIKVHNPSAIFESSETEGARKCQVGEADPAQLLSREDRLEKSKFKPQIVSEMNRPGMKQRFPSRDIWEDSPDSTLLETTVGTSQIDGTVSPSDEGIKAGTVVYTAGRPDKDHLSVSQTRDGVIAGDSPIDKPSVPPRPAKSKHTEGISDANGTEAVPPVPLRPLRNRQTPPANASSPLSKNVDDPIPTDEKDVSPTDIRKAPTLPDRPKPQLPTRPAKPVNRDSSESIPLPKTLSANSTGDNTASVTKGTIVSPPAPKPKPQLPARPVGSKIASLKAGFLSDLDKRLQLGPQAPPKVLEKPHEETEEKAPLGDARKGRAKGPARRKPAASLAGGVAADSKPSSTGFRIVIPQTIWEITSEGDGQVIHTNHPNTVSEPVESPVTVIEDPILASKQNVDAADSNVKEADVPPTKTTSGSKSTDRGAVDDENVQLHEPHETHTVTQRADGGGVRDSKEQLHTVISKAEQPGVTNLQDKTCENIVVDPTLDAASISTAAEIRAADTPGESFKRKATEGQAE